MSATHDDSETNWLSPSEQHNWRTLLYGMTALQANLDRELRQAHRISGAEYGILVRLSEAPDQTVRMAELAGDVSQSRSRMTHTISRLEAAGWVERSQCSSDGRGINAHLTPAGFALLAAASHTHVRGVREHLLNHASDEEFEVIARVFSRVLDELETL